MVSSIADKVLDPLRGIRHMRRKLVSAVFAALLVLCFVIIVYTLWLHGAFLPDWVRWKQVSCKLDLDGDLQLETIVLENRQLTITNVNGNEYISPEEWYISNVLIGDVNVDGIPELLFLCWKRGSFGTSKPFWQKNDMTTYFQHIFIVQYVEGDLVELWVSSDVGFKLQEAWLDDRDDVHLMDTEGNESVWEWQEWGLVLLEEGTPSYHGVEP